MLQRCAWCGDDPLYVAYHDTEWGVPVTDPRALYEMLMLEAFQAGLSWITILRKRESFRAAFAGFVPEEIAAWGPAEVDQLLANPGIVRHRGKIEATIQAARVWLDIEAQDGFAPFLWRFVEGKPLQNRPATMADVPAATDLSRAMSKELKARGFRFCGPTIVYAFMQAAGLVNDHQIGCHRQEAVAKLGDQTFF
ncbi:MAG: DNA-3-methyladenine glycosylase I [Pseudomonadota bacterium]